MFDPADWRSLLFSWDGRLRRSHFWCGMAALVVAQLLLGWLPFVGDLVGLALILPAASISVRRLHDMGHSGRLALVPMVGAAVSIVIGLIFGMLSGPVAAVGALALAGPLMLVMGIVALVNLAFVLWTGLASGVEGDNRFGPDPRQAGIPA
ncbi:DUF805 domain-containing protein [Brevundimonas sp.]|uniref:DUF805 domain-containing protein n=1 Tax=Brevundimonas sp. TaxID=1871086 RepID=UPI002FCC8AAF